MVVDVDLQGEDFPKIIALVAIGFVAMTFVSAGNPGGLVGQNVAAANSFGDSLDGQVSPVAHGTASVEDWRELSVPANVGNVSFADKELTISYSGFLNQPSLKVYDYRGLPFSAFVLRGTFVPGQQIDVRVSSLANGTVLVQFKQA